MFACVCVGTRAVVHWCVLLGTAAPHSDCARVKRLCASAHGLQQHIQNRCAPTPFASFFVFLRQVAHLQACTLQAATQEPVCAACRPLVTSSSKRACVLGRMGTPRARKCEWQTVSEHARVRDGGAPQAHGSAARPVVTTCGERQRPWGLQPHLQEGHSLRKLRMHSTLLTAYVPQSPAIPGEAHGCPTCRTHKSQYTQHPAVGCRTRACHATQRGEAQLRCACSVPAPYVHVTALPAASHCPPQSILRA